MALANFQAITLEQISFDFDKVSEVELNSVPFNEPYRSFQLISDFVTSKITISLNIPWWEPIPRSMIVKLNNCSSNSKSIEYREIIVNCSGHSSKVQTDGLVIMHADYGRPRYGSSYIQTAEFVLDFENYLKTLVCPISRKSIFTMCLCKAYDPQGERFPTVYKYS
jgi:hypothetical protein